VSDPERLSKLGQERSFSRRDAERRMPTRRLRRITVHRRGDMDSVAEPMATARTVRGKIHYDLREERLRRT